MLIKSQPNFWHYGRKMEAQAKNNFLIKKRVIGAKSKTSMK